MERLRRCAPATSAGNGRGIWRTARKIGNVNEQKRRAGEKAAQNADMWTVG